MKKMYVLIAMAAFLSCIGLATVIYARLTDQIAEEVYTQVTEQTEDTRIPAPDFTVLDDKGNEVKLSDYFGKPIILNFWASWCPPCKVEMPDFENAYQEMGGEIKFMMVDLVDGQRETMETGKAYIEKEGYTFPVYFDTEAEAAYAYAIRSIPTTLFINREGYVVTAAQGAINEATLRRGIGYIE